MPPPSIWKCLNTAGKGLPRSERRRLADLYAQEYESSQDQKTALNAALDVFFAETMRERRALVEQIEAKGGKAPPAPARPRAQEPEAPAPQEVPEPEAPAEVPKVETDADVLAAAGVQVAQATTTTGKEIWQIRGWPRDRNQELKDRFTPEGARRPAVTWYRKDKVWSLWRDHDEANDPTAILASILRGAGGPRVARDTRAGRRGDEDAALREQRRREDERPDERATIGSPDEFVADDTASLLRRGLERGIPESVINDQIDDAGYIAKAFEDKKPLFLLANEAGTGKTFVLGAAMREMKRAGAKRFVYLTMNQRLITQIRGDLAAYGVEPEFYTYSDLSTRGGVDLAGAVLIADEAHNLKNVKSARGRVGQRLFEEADFTVLASATLFENPVQAAYLEPTGIFAQAGGFVNWAKMYGASIRRIKDGYGNTIEIPYWTGGRVEDGQAAREWFFKQAVMTQRPMQIPADMVDVDFRRNEVSQEYVELYDQVTAAYETALQQYRNEFGQPLDSKIYAQIAMHQVNTVKRILEASKIPAGIARAREKLAEGREVVMFVETKADRELGRWRNTGGKGPTYSFEEVMQQMAEWQAEAGMARSMGERAPPRPFAESIVEIARAFNAHGIEYTLPSTADEIVKALGEDNVAIYTGAVSDAKANKNLDEWFSGKKHVLVATMAKGGTGLSLHDQVGDRPTTQININLPWVATGVDQVAGRTARYGLQSRAEIEWLFASNIPFEGMLAARVGGRMRDMGAIIKGIEIRAAEQLLGGFDFEGSVSVKQLEQSTRPEAREESIYELAERLERTEGGREEDTTGGFFQTPYKLAALITRVADARPGERLLEPSAGNGRMLAFVPENVAVKAVEQNPQRAGEIRNRNPDADVEVGDFLEWAKSQPAEYDVVQMNPPFERLKGVGPQDAAHVRQAYELLRPNGRLVAIMGEGLFFRSQKAETEFREWLDTVGATVVKLPRDAFKTSGTQVQTRLVVIDKTGEGARSDLELDSFEDIEEAEELFTPRPEVRERALEARSVLPRARGLPAASARRALVNAYGEEFEALEAADVVRVVQSINNVPIGDRGNLYRARGVYFGQSGRVYIVADHMIPGREPGLMLHEVGIHYGLEHMVGHDEFNNIKKQVLRLARTNAKVRRAYNQVPKHTHPGLVAEETLAYLVEFHPELNIVQRVIAKVKAFLRKMGLNLKYSPADFVALARASVRFSAEKAGEGRMVRPWLDAVTANDAWTKEFIDWFGDSQIVTGAGEPKVMYHGTRADFTEFSPAETRTTGHPGNQLGYFFTSDPGYADIYATEGGSFAEGANVMPVYLSVKNPVRMSLDEYHRTFGPMSPEQVEGWKRRAIEKGHDGLIATDQSGTLDEVVAFEPTQVKSAIGNSGAYGNTTESILFAQASQVPPTGQSRATFYGVTAGGTVSAVAFPQRKGYSVIIFRDANGQLFYRGAIRQNVDSRTEAWRVIEKYGLTVRRKPSVATQLQQQPIFQPSYNPARAELEELLAAHWQDQMKQPVKAIRAWGYRARLGFQDKFLTLRDQQREIVQSKGELELSEDVNAYLAEELYHGRAAARMEAFEREMIVPLMKKISDSGLEMSEVDLYLHAKHAAEANAYLQQINPDRPNNEALSGMSNDEAAGVLTMFELEGKTAELEAIARDVYAINEARLDAFVEYGLESEAKVREWRSMYRFYVPLHRDHGEGAILGKRSKGFSVGGREVYERTGSDRPVAHILGNVVGNYEGAVLRGEKNRVSQALLKLAQENPNPDLWDINQIEYKARLDKETGLVYLAPDPQFDAKPHVLDVKVNGKVHRISFNEKNLTAMRIAHAMKNLGANEIGPFIQALHNVTRFLATVNTSWSPEFIISNFIRDLQTAGINLEQTEAQGLGKEILLDVRHALKGIKRAVRNNDTSGWSGYYREFELAGGKTGWLQLYDDAEARVRELHKILAEHRSPKNPKVLFRKMLNTVSDYNTIVENAVRLSTYVHLRRRGHSEKKAASVAKNLTVNFNRKGDYGKHMNALYLFFNASIQGIARLFTAAYRSSKVRKMLGVAVLVGFALDVINRMIAPDDDDGENTYDKIPPWVRERNWVLMNPWGDGDYVTLPMPYGYNVFPLMGQMAARAMPGIGSKDWSAVKEAGDLSIAFLNSFMPLGGEATAFQLVAPTIADPFVQWAENTDWAGRPLYREQMPFGAPRPEHTMYYGNTSPQAVGIAKFLAEATGGDEFKPGLVDLNPAFLDHMVSFVTGSAGRFVSDVGIELPYHLLTDPLEIEAIDVPFLRRVYRQPAKGPIYEEFYERINRIDMARKRVTAYGKAVDQAGSPQDKAQAQADYDRVKEEHRTDTAMRGKARRVEKRIRELRRRLDNLEKKDLPTSEKNQQRRELREQIESKMKEFIRAYNEGPDTD